MKKLYKQELLLIISFILSLFLISCGGGAGSTTSHDRGGHNNIPYAPITSASKEIISYSINGNPGIITGQKIIVYMPYDTNLQALVADYKTTGLQVLAKNNDTSQIESQTSGVTANDFTESVNYIIKAADGSTATYIVDVVVGTNSSNDIMEFSINGRLGIIDGQNISIIMPHHTNLNALTATFMTTGNDIKVNDNFQISGVTENNFTNPVIYKVISANKSEKDYTVRVTEAPESDNSILSFKLEDYLGTINQDDRSIKVTVPYGTNLKKMVARFATSGSDVRIESTMQVSGETQNDFTNNVVYTVSAYDGTASQYVVKVNVLPIVSIYVFYPGIYYTNFQNPESYGDVNIEESLSRAYHISFDDFTGKFLGYAMDPINVGSIYNNTYGEAYAMEADPNNESLVWVFSANITNDKTDNRIQAFQIQADDELTGLNNTTSKIRRNVFGAAPWLNKAIVAKKNDPADLEYIYQIFTSNDGGSSIDKYFVDLNGKQANYSSGSTPDKDQKFDMVITPDGQYGYVTNYNNNRITEYRIDSSGSWAIIGAIDSGGDIAAQILVDKHGEYLYVLNESSNNIVVFKIDNSTGALTKIQDVNVPMAQDVSSMLLDPNGGFIYVSSVTNDFDTHIYTYQINDGLLVNGYPVSQIAVGNINDIPDKLFIDPSGSHLVYVNVLCHNALYMLNINKNSGELSDLVKQPITDSCTKSEPTIIIKLKQ